MNLLGKLNKLLGVAIAGVLFTTFIVASKRGLINLPNFKDKEETRDYEEEFDPELHRELLANYNEYVESIANEIRLVGRDSSIADVFASYIFLEENGFISLGSEFTHEQADNELGSSLGFNVATGSAQSQNQVNNFMNVAASLGYDVHLVSGCLYQEGKKAEGVSSSLCYAIFGDHDILLDPVNRTIFLKNGSTYRSIDKDELLFKPDLMYDREAHNYPDNKGLYNNMENTYKDCGWIADEFKVKKEKIKESAEFFSDYEEANLLEYEQFISDYMDAYEQSRNTDEYNKTLSLEGE